MVSEFGKINVSELTPYEHNARTHTYEQIGMIADSLKEFGFINPIIIDEHNLILAGHGRVEAAKVAGLTEVPYRRISGLSEEQKRAYVLVDNKLFDMGQWDYDALHVEVEKLDIDMTRFGYEEFLKSDILNEDAENNIDEGKELSVYDFEDESFRYKCPCCGFSFNKGGK